jgi:hypothetical protein
MVTTDDDTDPGWPIELVSDWNPLEALDLMFPQDAFRRRRQCGHQRLSLYERIILSEAGAGRIEDLARPYAQPLCQCVTFATALRPPWHQPPPLHRVLGATVALHRVHPLEWCAENQRHYRNGAELRK